MQRYFIYLRFKNSMLFYSIILLFPNYIKHQLKSIERSKLIHPMFLYRITRPELQHKLKNDPRGSDAL